MQKTHDRSFLLTLKNPSYVREVMRFTTEELIRDLGDWGDITTDAFFGESDKDKKRISMCVVARGSGIFAGELEIRYFLTSRNKSVRYGTGSFNVHFLKRDGDELKRGDRLLIISGKIRDILRIERVLLNLIGRMSGVATFVRAVVQKASKINPNIYIAPTRKTLWGLLDKRACAIGGALTHRLNLSDALIIKDNHIDAARDLLGMGLETVITTSTATAGRKKAHKNSPAFFEVEVTSKKQAVKVAKAIHELQIKKELMLPCFLLLDNQTPEHISEIKNELVQKGLVKKIYLEASGGITLKNVAKYAATGVDVISMGAITHSAPNFDVTLRSCADERERLPVLPFHRRKI